MVTVSKVDDDPYHLKKVRGTPLGNVSSCYKDVLCIEAMQDVFDEYYIEIVKKGNKDNGQKSARTKADFNRKLTKAVNAAQTTTPLNPAKDCLAAKNFVAAVEKNVAKIIKDESGIRECKT